MSDEAAALAAHNKARERKGCRPLQWSTRLTRDAEAYARVLASRDVMEHAGVQGQGENLFKANYDVSFEVATQWWLDEKKDYHGERIGEGNLSKWGHYTQCVWHSTTHVGMGKAKSRTGNTYIVARYTPQGNMFGEKPF